MLLSRNSLGLENGTWFISGMVAQSVKNLPAMQETGVQSLSWEDHLKEGMATHASILSWRIPWTEEALQGQGGHSPRCHIESDTTEQLTL